MALYTSITQLVGGTPLLELRQYGKAVGAGGALLGKLEYFNPAGSVKDRAALAMILDAEERGLLRPGSAIIEPTSGNTGIGLAAMGIPRGYRVILTMPDSMSAERRALLSAYGAELVLTPGEAGMAGAISKAEELAAALPGSFIPGQFSNPANAQAHYRTTGPEIWQDTEGKVDAFVAGVGSGGTITGVGRYLKEQNSALQVVAAAPPGSPVLPGCETGPPGLQGIGGGFVPEVLDTGVYDQILQVTEENAYAAARLLARTEGVLVGISAGAALWAATELSRKPAWAGKSLVVLLPDTGDRYLSTPLFSGDGL